MTKFFVSLLSSYGVHISQMNALGVMRMRHFEFVCRAHNIEPQVPMFNVFYRMTCQSGFYSFAHSFAHRSAKIKPVAVGMSRIWRKVDRVPIFKVDDIGMHSNLVGLLL